MDINEPLLFGTLIASLHVLGGLSVINALMSTRTSQGAIAWAIALITFPYLALPLYWIFGRDKFRGYVKARGASDQEIEGILNQLREYTSVFVVEPETRADECRVFSKLAPLPLTAPNSARLLVDGEATFGAIFEAVEQARDYVLVQFFIIKDDNLGRELARRLTAASTRGVRVFLLFDQIGSHKLSRKYIHDLRRAGVDIHSFKTNKGLTNPFHFFFRYHRWAKSLYRGPERGRRVHGPQRTVRPLARYACCFRGSLCSGCPVVFPRGLVLGGT